MNERKTCRVLHVLNELRPSGAESMLASAGNLWREAGISATIVATGQDIGPYAERLRDSGFEIIHVPFAKSPRFFARFWQILKSHPWDAIHLHTERANFYFGILAALSRRGRVIRTVHSAFDYSGVLRWRRAIQRRILSAAGVRFVAISEGVREIEESRFGVRCNVVENWYDSNRFRVPSVAERREARALLGIADDCLVFAIVGNCSDIKNHQLALRALAGAKLAQPWVLMHVGLEEEGFLERELARSLGIAENVMFLGGRDDVPALLWAADVFLHPSLREGFGIAMLEAIACQAHPIASDVPGLRSVIREFEGMRGYPTDLTSWTEAVLAAAGTDRTSRRRMGELWSKRARARFAIERGANMYASLYRGEAQ